MFCESVDPTLWQTPEEERVFEGGGDQAIFCLLASLANPLNIPRKGVLKEGFLRTTRCSAVRGHLPEVGLRTSE